MSRRQTTQQSLGFNREEVLNITIPLRGQLLPNSSNMLVQRPRHRYRTSPNTATKSDVVLVHEVPKSLQDVVHKQLAEDDTFLAVLALLTTLVAVIHNEDLYENNNELTSSMNSLRILQAFLTVLSLWWVHQRYQALLTIEIMKQKVSPSLSLWQSPLRTWFVIEFVLFSMTTIPYVEYVFTIEMLGYEIDYTLNSVLTFLTVLRLYSLVRLFGYVTPYMQGRAHKICEENGESPSLLFAIKCTLATHPSAVTIIAFSLISIFAAFCLCLNERPDRTTTVDGVESEDPSLVPTYIDSVWLVFVSSTTVGYGDIYPTTHLGRLIIISVAIVGNMCLGVLAVGLVARTQHSDDERLAFNAIVRAEHIHDIRDKAARVVQLAYRLYKGGQTYNSLKSRAYTEWSADFTARPPPRKIHSRHLAQARAELVTAKEAAREVAMDTSEFLNYTGDRLTIGMNDLSLKMKAIASARELLQLSDIIQQHRQIEDLGRLANKNFLQILSRLEKRRKLNQV